MSVSTNVAAFRETVPSRGGYARYLEASLGFSPPAKRTCDKCVRSFVGVVSLRCGVIAQTTRDAVGDVNHLASRVRSRAVSWTAADALVGFPAQDTRT